MRPSPYLPREATLALLDRFGDAVVDTEKERFAHTPTPTWLQSQPPAVVLFVAERVDVVDAVRLCARFELPVIPFGAGTSLEGQVNAPLGGVSIDFRRMNRVVEIASDDMYAVVEPGITHVELNRALAGHGLFFPVDPGAGATLGGMASTRASGTNSMRYGTMRENVMGLEVILASGEVIRTGSRARKSASGYDLTHLFVGAEGTLGLITELTLRVYPVPPCVAGGKCPFPDVAAAVSTVVEAQRTSASLARIEFLDEFSIDACNRYSGLDLPLMPTLFVEFHGDPSEVERSMERFGSIAAKQGGRFLASADPSELSSLWRARKDAWHAIHALRQGWRGVTTDVCVPISRLPSCVKHARETSEALGLPVALIGHMGDGNFHALILLDPDVSDAVSRARMMVESLNEQALSCGGTCTGEHGIGQGKIAFAAREHGLAIEVMRQLKHALDPQLILNPAKIF